MSKGGHSFSGCTESPFVLMLLLGRLEESEELLRPVSSPIKSGGGVAYILAAITNYKGREKGGDIYG